MNEQSVPRWRHWQQGTYLLLLLGLLSLALLSSCSTVPSTPVIQPRLPDPPSSLQKKLPPLQKVPTAP